MKFICTLCNYVFDENQRDSVEDGKSSFQNLSDDWRCPGCAAAKEYFATCSCTSLSCNALEAGNLKQIEAA